MVRNFSKHLCSFVSVAATLVIALYPFSHFPLLPVVNISPFQFLGVLVALFGAVTLILWVLKNKKNLPHKRTVLLQSPLFWSVVLFAWLLVSFLWGGQTSHELYYICLAAAAFLFAIGIYTLLRIGRVSLDYLFKVIIVVGVLLGMWAIWQFIGESAGVSQSYTGICKTCLQHDIGFARASGFSQEPEHFSTVLLAPIVLVLTLLLLGRTSQKRQLLLWGSLIVMLIALLLASSRSGLLALGFILVSFSGRAFLRHMKWFVGGLCSGFVVSVITVLLLVAWSGTVGDASGSKYAIERYVAHATGGVIVLGDEQKRLSEVEISIKERVEDKAPASEFNYVTDARDYGPSGAIVYSAESRLETYKTAISIWTTSLSNFLIGVGWGNFGAIAHVRNPAAFNQDTIVNNQYLQIASELGFVGLLLFALAAGSAARFVYRSTLGTELKIAIAVLFIAYGIQLLFYSGLHLLQLWLTMAIIAYIIFVKKSNRHKVMLTRKRPQ